VIYPMADGDLEVIKSTVQKTHEWPAAIAQAGAARLPTLSPHTRTLSSTTSVFFSSERHQRHAILAAGHVLAKLAAAAIPVAIILTVGVLAMAAFVGGYLAALR
jgi:hypothetical protein